MFDRFVLINLDKRRDRLGAFKAKILEYPIFKDFIRVRAVHGDTTGVPQFFISGAGAYGCRQSHLRVLEDAMMDKVNTLCVLEDDVLFVDDFENKLKQFMSRIPDDWDGLMLGGQNMAQGSQEVGIDGVRKAINTQRTHCYVVRGYEAMKDLYKLWARCERHIDHVFGQWQRKWIVYHPEPFIAYQDKGPSDISGRNEKIRSWNHGTTDTAPKDFPLVVLMCDRGIAEQVRTYGFHFGHDRDPVTGLDKGLTKIALENWPTAKLMAWGNTIVSEAIEMEDVPGMWHNQIPDPTFLEARLGRKIKLVEGRTADEIVRKVPELVKNYSASKVIWCYKSGDIEIIEGMKHFGWHRGNWLDEVTGLDQGLRGMAQTNNWSGLRNMVRQLRREILTVRHGKILLAHPELNVDEIRRLFPDDRVVELTGNELASILDQLETAVGGKNE